MKPRRLSWIATESIGRKPEAIKGFEKLISGLITIEVDSERTDDFQKHWSNLDPNNNEKRNVWLKSFWEYNYNCSFSPRSSKKCSPKEESTRSEIFSKIKPTINAVKAYASALDALKKDMPINFLCNYTGDHFFEKYLLDAKSKGAKIFDYHGDPKQPKYAIYQYQYDFDEDLRGYQNIGHWFDQRMSLKHDLNATKLKWNFNGNKRSQHEIPESSCSQACDDGQVLETKGGVCCSGNCMPCKEYEYKYDAYTCSDCNQYGNDTLDWMPNPDKRGCQPPAHKILSPISMFLCMWGMTFTCITIYAFINNLDTPIVKNSSKEHCIIVLVGLLFVFLNATIIEAPRTAAICGLIRYAAPLGFSMVYSALLVKLNRVHRIFQVKLESKNDINHKRKSKKPFQPSYTSVYSTLWMTAGFIGVQVFISTVLILYDPPKAIPVYPDPSNSEIFLRKNDDLKKCSIHENTLAISHLYFCCLMIACTYYAVKTRKIPENFKETKSIGFAMYSTCILWLLAIPLYFGAKYQHYHTKSHLYAVTTSISGFIILACVFIQKTYIILCKPEKNRDERVRMSVVNQSPFRQAQESVRSYPVETSSESYVCSRCRTKTISKTTNESIMAVSSTPSV